MKRRKMLGLRWLMGLVAVSFLLSGCAAGGGVGTAQGPAPGKVELLLVQAGFETVPDEHPLCVGVCRNLQPGLITPYTKAGKKLYGFLSPETKRLYVGTEGEYQKFVNLAVTQQVEEKFRPLANESTDPQFWNMWADMYGGH